MTSIIVDVFTVTIGFLVNEGRSKAAEKLKDSDVTDQKLRSLIVDEIEEMKAKLNELSRKDLLAAIDSFRVGFNNLGHFK